MSELFPVPRSRTRTHINSLPPELLSIIFIFSLPTDSVLDSSQRHFALTNRTITRKTEPLKLVSVCSYWQAVALATPELWRWISFGYGTHEYRAVGPKRSAAHVRRHIRGFRQFVPRARAMKLDIRANYEHLADPFQYRNPRYMDDKFKQYLANVQTALTRFTGVIVPLRGQIQRLDLGIHWKLGAGTIGALMREHFPVLEVLNIHCYSQFSIPVTLSHLPALRHLSLRGTGLYIRPTDSFDTHVNPQMQQIQAQKRLVAPVPSPRVIPYLKLVDCLILHQMPPVPSWESPLHVINLTVQFQHSFGFRPFSTEHLITFRLAYELTFHTPTIRHLKLVDQMPDAGNAVCFLCLLRFPNLESLDLSECPLLQWGNVLVSMDNFVRRSGNPPLKMIKLEENWHMLGIGRMPGQSFQLQ